MLNYSHREAAWDTQPSFWTLRDLRAKINRPRPRSFINEPASVMDLGVYKMERAIAGALVAASYSTVSVSVTYSWDENQIAVSLLEINMSRSTRVEAIAFCKELIGKARIALGMNVLTGTPLFENAGGAQFFRHEGYSTTKEPKSLATDINRMIRIRSTVEYRMPQIGIARCEAPLLGKEILISQ